MFGKVKFWIFLLVAVLSIGIFGVGKENPTPVMRESEAPTRKEIQNVLILGHDKTSGLTDTLILASFNRAENQLTLYQIPRDTYFASHGGSYRKINGACKALGSTAAFAEALSGALGVEIDGYIEFDPSFVKAAVDLVGGVTLDVPCDMDYDDPAQGLSIHLKKGRQTLDGEAAVEFIRYRSGYVRADLGRMDAQKLFLAAFARAAGQNIKSNDIPRAILLGMKYIKSDMRVGELSSLALALRTLAPSGITALTLPGEEIQSEKSGAWYYILSKSGCEEIFENFDPEGKFTNLTRKQFNEIYNRYIAPVPYDFAMIGKEGIGGLQKGTN